MDVILLERVEKLGAIGDVVKVKDGFARNYLLPNKKALRANESNRKLFEANRARIEDDERNGVAYFRSKGMQVVENVDRSKFQEVLAPVFVEFSKKFGEANIQRIRDFK